MKSQSWIILEIGGALFLLGLLSFFYAPAYEKGLWTVITIFGVQLANLLGSKSGSSLPQQVGGPREGDQSSSTSSTTSSVKVETGTPTPAAVATGEVKQ